MNGSDTTTRLKRRHLLAVGTAAVGALSAPVARPAVAPAVLAELTAQTTEGPYYLEGMPVRADITEGLPGVPLEVRLNVVDAASVPLPGCRVDVWQCDASGIYSGFAGQGDDCSISAVGKTFLRGSLVTGTDGMAAFRAIYPGWYAGRRDPAKGHPRKPCACPAAHPRASAAGQRCPRRKDQRASRH